MNRRFHQRHHNFALCDVGVDTIFIILVVILIFRLGYDHFCEIPGCGLVVGLVTGVLFFVQPHMQLRGVRMSQPVNN